MVRNKILIDVQGEDVLMQIFTSTVLQRKPGTEAPFLEFIQRLCAIDEPAEAAAADGGVAEGTPARPIRPGCGGFGIRNFLTLFLSIEVSKAMLEKAKADKAGQSEKAAFYGKMVDMFTEQLVEANPILTAISDAMTGEGEATLINDAELAATWASRKEAANAELQVCLGITLDLAQETRRNGLISSPTSWANAAGALG